MKDKDTLAYQSQSQFSSALLHTQEIAQIGSWVIDLVKQTSQMSQVAYDIHELSGNETFDIDTGIEYYCKEHQALIRQCVDDAINHGKSWNVEVKLITAKGNEKWVRTNGRPIVTHGQVTGLEGTIQDIHERKELELERESFIRRVEQTEKMALIGHWEWTFHPEKILWSKGLYDIWQYDPSLPPPSIEDRAKWIHEDDKELFYETIRTNMENQTPYSLVFRAWFDNKIKYIQADATPVLNDNNEITGFFGTAIDVTKQQTVEAELRRANEELSQFAYRTSHDLKAPLVSIKGLSNLIKYDLKNNNMDEALKSLDHIHDQADKLSNLVVDILDLAKAELKTVENEAVVLLDVLKAIAKQHELLAAKFKVKLIFNVPANVIIHTQKIRLQQALENLIVNGIKYSNEERQNSFVKVWIKQYNLFVQDNGVGIPAQHQKDIYSLFKRFHPNKCEGSGLGMSIVKKHIDGIKGFMLYTSSDEGTTFKITLPKEAVVSE